MVRLCHTIINGWRLLQQQLVLWVKPLAESKLFGKGRRRQPLFLVLLSLSVSAVILYFTTVECQSSVNHYSYRSGTKTSGPCTLWTVVLAEKEREIQNLKQAAPIDEWCVVVVLPRRKQKWQLFQNKCHSDDVWTTFLHRQVLSFNSSQIHILTPTKWSKRPSDKSKEPLILSAVERFIQRELSSCSQQDICLKNVGYLYALQHGAQRVMDGSSLPTSSWTKFIGAATQDLRNVQVPIITSNDPPLFDPWIPKKNTNISVAYEITRLNTAHHHLAIIHGYETSVIVTDAKSASDNETSKKINGNTTTQSPAPLLPLDMEQKPFLIPQRQFAAMHPGGLSLFTASSLWSLLLPQPFQKSHKVTSKRRCKRFTPLGAAATTRNLISQRLLHDLNLQIAMVPYRSSENADGDPSPSVPHRRVPAKLKDEISCGRAQGHDIRFLELVQFLDEWNAPPSLDTTPARLEAMYIGLLEHGFVSEHDVASLKLWLAALVELNYAFPPIKRYRHDNILLSGQFNYADTGNVLDNVAFWVQKWRQVFRHVQVRGPFSVEQLSQLQHRGIEAYALPFDRGLHSPMENLARSLEQAQNNMSGIDGVMYVHDDAYLNFTQLLGGNSVLSPFPVRDIIGSMLWYFPASYMDARQFFVTQDGSSNNNTHDNLPPLISVPGRDTKMQALLSIYRVAQPRGTYHTPLGSKVQGNQFKKLHTSLIDWHGYRQCIAPIQFTFHDLQKQKLSEPVNTDPTQKKHPFHRFLDSRDGSLYVPSPTQADFLFVPVKYATAFGQAAEYMVRNYVFLECGIPLIVQMLRHAQELQDPDDPVTVRTIDLCTSWKEDIKQPAWIIKCMHESENTEWRIPGKTFGMYHPWKLAVAGLARWEEFFDRITFA